MKNLDKILICGLLFFAVSLRIYRVGNNSYMGDEARVVELCSGTNFLWEDIHPPLYRILLAGWIRLFGTNETSTRVLSMILGTFSLWFIYLIGKELGGKRIGLTALYLGAISPFFVLFSRITRVFPCFLFFNLCSLWFFLLVLKNENRLWMYTITTILSLYAGTFAVLTLICEWMWLLLNLKSINKKKWAISQVIILLAASFWIIKIYSIAPSVLASFNRVPSVHGTPGNIGYIIFSFSLGQTILPWNFKIAVPGLFVFLISTIHGLQMLIKKKWNKELLFLLIFIFVPLLPICTNIDAPHYYLHVAALYCLLVGIGITYMRRFIRVAIVIFIAGTNAYGVRNIYINREYHLQSFTDNWREIVACVKTIADEEDKVVAYHKAFIWYYALPNLIVLHITNSERTHQELIGAKKIVFVYTPLSGTFSSNDEGIYKFKEWLDQNFLCTQSVEFFENEDYEIKRKLLKRSFPRFRVQVFIYERRNEI